MFSIIAGDSKLLLVVKVADLSIDSSSQFFWRSFRKREVFLACGKSRESFNYRLHSDNQPRGVLFCRDNEVFRTDAAATAVYVHQSFDWISAVGTACFASSIDCQFRHFGRAIDASR